MRQVGRILACVFIFNIKGKKSLRSSSKKARAMAVSSETPISSDTSFWLARMRSKLFTPFFFFFKGEPLRDPGDMTLNGLAKKEGRRFYPVSQPLSFVLLRLSEICHFCHFPFQQVTVPWRFFTPHHLLTFLWEVVSHFAASLPRGPFLFASFSGEFFLV